VIDRKYCKDCKHAVQGYPEPTPTTSLTWMCNNPALTDTDLVTGTVKRTDCATLRQEQGQQYGLLNNLGGFWCGRRGRYWEAKAEEPKQPDPQPDVEYFAGLDDGA
jgi:hypothetical protein